MNAVIKICKRCHHNQHFVWPTSGYPLLPNARAVGLLLKTVPAVPSLFHLASTRTLTSLRLQKTHYEILDLSHLATTKEIRHAYLKLSKQYHPDTSNNPTNHKKFVQVNEAYTVLSKPASRRDYDASLSITASTSRSHPHGHHPQSDYYSFYDETDWVRKYKMQRSEHMFTTRCLITAYITYTVVGAIVLFYMEPSIPIPKAHPHSKN
uniref:J domain-containing protein n=1 Tax=Arion vulgaris TaxID=1028688 RepID=A0A0B7AVR2_9EUPU